MPLESNSPGLLLRCLLIIEIICSVTGDCYAQSEKTPAENKETKFYPEHTLGIALGHAHVFGGRDEAGNSKTLAMPMWGLDYTFKFSPHWAAGLHTDIIIQRYLVEKTYSESDDVVERSYPVAPAVVGIRMPDEHWNFLLGVGGEFAKEGIMQQLLTLN